MKKPDFEEPVKPRPNVNDILAMERTIMANERTFLAYIRTALTLFVPGVTGMALADTFVLKAVAFLFIPLGLVVFFIGLMRFRKKRNSTRSTVR